MVTPVSEVRTYLTLGTVGSGCDVAGADATTARATAAAAPILAFTLRMVIYVPLFRSTDTTETSPDLGRPLQPGSQIPRILLARIWSTLPMPPSNGFPRLSTCFPPGVMATSCGELEPICI